MTEAMQEDPGGELQRLAPLVDIEIGRKHKRPMCLSCNRPASVCWCCSVDSTVLQGVRCRVVVLQHPHEEKRCLRTAPMLENALPHCAVYRGKRFSEDLVPELTSPDSLLLFPGPDAADVGSLETVGQRGRPYNLVVLDGTWHQARGILHRTHELRRLPKVSVQSPVLSQYVIRTQPSDAAVSTVECAALALAVLEADPRIYATLVQPLATLCRHQLSHGAVVHHSKEHRYKEANAPAIGKRTAKTLAQCGAAMSISSRDGCRELQKNCLDPPLIGDDDSAPAMDGQEHCESLLGYCDVSAPNEGKTTMCVAGDEELTQISASPETEVSDETSGDKKHR